MDLTKERSDLEEIESKLNHLKAIYELKKLKINEMNSKVHEKSTLINEAEKAYTKVRNCIKYQLIENASKFINEAKEICGKIIVQAQEMSKELKRSKEQKVTWLKSS